MRHAPALLGLLEPVRPELREAVAWEMRADTRWMSSHDVAEAARLFKSGELVPPRPYDFEGYDVAIVQAHGFYWLVALAENDEPVRDTRLWLKLGRAKIIAVPLPGLPRSVLQ